METLKDTYLLVYDDGTVIGHYDHLSGAKKRRTALINLSGGRDKLRIVKVITVETVVGQ
jgi:hypothetical protein